MSLGPDLSRNSVKGQYAAGPLKVTSKQLHGHRCPASWQARPNLRITPVAFVNVRNHADIHDVTCAALLHCCSQSLNDCRSHSCRTSIEVPNTLYSQKRNYNCNNRASSSSMIVLASLCAFPHLHAHPAFCTRNVLHICAHMYLPVPSLVQNHWCPLARTNWFPGQEFHKWFSQQGKTCSSLVATTAIVPIVLKSRCLETVRFFRTTTNWQLLPDFAQHKGTSWWPCNL